MYNNSPRFGLKFPSATPPEVNPYTYILDDPLQVKRVNVVPFGSSAERKFSTAHIKYTDAIYNVKAGSNIVGGRSLQNKAKRFVYKISDTPPPGTYNPKIPEKRKQPSNVVPPGKGRIYYCRVPYSLLGSAPSIPTKKEADGYDIRPDGRLIKNQVVFKEKSIGPSTYHVKLASRIEDPYSGCRWSRRTAKRDMYKFDKVPGPAEYDVGKVSTCRWDAKEEEYREMARRLAYLPRYTEQQQFIAQKLNFPAPCKYSKPSCFDYKPPVTTVVKPFVTRKPRFAEEKERDAAIHADYNITTSMGTGLTCSLKRAPFSSTAERFKRKKKSEGDPEPELYLPKGIAEIINEKNSKPYALVKAPFDSTVERNFNVSQDLCLDANCATYPREQPPVGYKVQSGHSVFVSATLRTEPIYSVVPPPSTYLISDAFNKMRNSTSHNKKNVSFQATSERKTVVLPLKKNPGPADYLGKDGIHGKHLTFNKTVRFKEKKSDVPPPDHYYVFARCLEQFFAGMISLKFHDLPLVAICNCDLLGQVYLFRREISRRIWFCIWSVLYITPSLSSTDEVI
ncbi:hypothetical protein WA026_008188 [Henosepilachna vigintioctopunctata]|uniref:Sperm-tail PG-rich repeat-containing protein 2 n=1 Tax=Henosepilachna vigintioctopunctata TaxID=420089 RepID=A0AAW1TIP1_9CUCU